MYAIFQNEGRLIGSGGTIDPEKTCFRIHPSKN